ncbi:MAG: DNA polymerase III subunit delta [Gemmatimonadaceae bacterium]
MTPRPSITPRESSPQRTVLAAVQSSTFAPVYYLFGDDDYLKDVAIHELLGAALDASTRDFNCEVRRGNEMDAEAVNDTLGTPPMLAERRGVVIRDVTLLKKAPRAQLDKYLTRPASDTLLLLVTSSGTKEDAALADASVALNFGLLPPERVRRWIQHQTTTVLKATITDDAVKLLQQAVGNDLQTLAGELDKCASYVLGARESTGAEASNEIDAETVSAIVGVRRGETVTDLLDAVARFDANAAVNLVPFVLQQPKITAVQIVNMMATQAFALAYGRSRKDAGVATGKLPNEFFSYLKEVGGFPGRPWSEAASAWTKEVEGWSAQSCARALALLLEADIALKETVISDGEQTLTSLVLALCALRPRSRKVA